MRKGDIAMDCLTPEQRRKNMQAIRCSNTSIEILLRKELWKRGLRYKVNSREVFGRPDILFTKKKVAIFCDSEFWHGYEWEDYKKRIGTNREYWIPKIERNMERDLEVNSVLESQGYIVIRFWGKEIQKNVCRCADVVENALKNL